MEMRKEIITMLDLMRQPAFCVESGVIRHINPAAGRFMLTVGQPIAPILDTGAEDYAIFTGCMQLRMCLGGQLLDTTVVRQDGVDIFLPDTVTAAEHCRILSLAAMQLREPLTGLSALVDKISDPVTAGQINRRQHQLLRILSNMSDVQHFSDRNACRMEYTEIGTFIAEILEKAAALLESVSIRVESQLPTEAIYALADRDQLERALYNLISNAVKFSLPGTAVQVQLRASGQRLYLSVSGQSRSATDPHDFYDRFLREPGLEDPVHGLGLGLVLVRCVAANHGGAVFIDQPDGHSTRVTMSLARQTQSDSLVRSPILRMDYTGERDHGLFELADVLPAELYQPNRI
ncbi:MAG: HAMP domain-containing histidine kinase [Ruminococcaceae bacterium]|nr:HAMP domain-containing histidine kinase [Oscillospiraceae bacterium]